MKMMTDLLGRDASELLDKRLFLFDMDGTIYLGSRVFDGARELLREIKSRGARYVFITNNSSRSRADYVKKLTSLRIAAGTGDLFTSSQATAMYLNENYPGVTVYCMGTRSLCEELTAAEIRVTQNTEDKPGLVLLGYDTELTYKKLDDVCMLLSTVKDIPYVATHPDWVCPVSYGFAPDCGCFIQMIEKAAGRRPVVIGKPHPEMIYAVEKHFGVSRGDTVVIGDRIYTDIASGQNAGVTTVLVLSGETTRDALDKSELKPDFVFRDVNEIRKTVFSG